MERVENIRKIIEGAPDGIVIVNTKGEILLINSQTEKLFNYDREELIGKSIEVLIPDSYKAINDNYGEEFYKHPSTRPMVPNINLKGKRKNEKVFDTEISLSPLITAQEKLVVIITIRDITKRIQLEEKFHKTQGIFKRIFDSSISGIAKFQTIYNDSNEIIDFKYEVVNNRAKELVRVPDENYFSKTVTQNIANIKDSKVFKTMIKVVQTGDTEFLEFTIERKEKIIWYKGSFVKVDDGLIITFDDITTQKEAENKLFELNQELEKRIESRTHELYIANQRLQSINEKLDRYAYMISHDLKAPITNTEGLIQFIEQDYIDKPLDEEGQEILAMMKSKLNSMRGIIDNVLQSAKDEIKNRETINLQQAVQDVINTLNPPSYFHFFVQHNLPTINYPKTSIIQILQNLLSNSIKYMDKDNPLISISYTEDKSFYYLCVTDNGRGIAKNKLKEVFNLFEVAHPTIKNIESHGIGLAIVKQLIEENGGQIYVESELGKETRFQFSIRKE